MANSTQDSRVSVPAAAAIADHGRHGAGNRAHRGGPPRPLLHGRVQKQVAGQREGADQPGQQVHAQPQFQEAGHGKGQRRRPARRRERCGRRAAAGRRCAAFCGRLRARTTGSAPRCRRRSDPCPMNGVEQREQRNALEELPPAGAAGKAEEIADPGAHEDQPGDSRLGQFDVIAHECGSGPGMPRPCINRCKGERSLAPTASLIPLPSDSHPSLSPVPIPRSPDLACQISNGAGCWRQSLHCIRSKLPRHRSHAGAVFVITPGPRAMPARCRHGRLEAGATDALTPSSSFPRAAGSIHPG